ncbi:MAG: hypothetical protein KBF98_12185 [Rhodoferax sp.]|nr:hypothetical protein [Rhodoferax sp.]
MAAHYIENGYLIQWKPAHYSGSTLPAVDQGAEIIEEKMVQRTSSTKTTGEADVTLVLTLGVADNQGVSGGAPPFAINTFASVIAKYNLDGIVIRGNNVYQMGCGIHR